MGRGERERGGAGGLQMWSCSGSEVRPINKQRIDFLPLSTVPVETPLCLHRPLTLISTYVKDVPRWGKPALHATLPPPPPPWLVVSLGHLQGTVHLR